MDVRFQALYKAFQAVMELSTFAQSLLFGSTLEEKLLSPEPDHFTDSKPGAALEQAPRFPGRPPHLNRPGKARFPSLARIHEPETRGEILHFFANHELLALELMALVLLRFPEAPESFRVGVARTILEEQGHLRLYIARMNELGVRFGDLPVNDYFWKTLRIMRTPMDFVTQMSLTFEQANLDFSLFYRNEVEKAGDQATTEILDRVFREEIGHVKHGLLWFNRWREETRAAESDWDAYVRLLPPPLNPQRAKGLLFSAEARRQAGLSERFIRELELYSGSKGRPPILWIYNPFCDAEIARGKPGYTPKEKPLRLARDLEHLPMFLASSQDTVLVHQKPSLSWLGRIREAGFEIPDWGSPDLKRLRERKFGGFEPWGWSPEVFEMFRPFSGRLVSTSDGNASWLESLFIASTFSETGLAEIFSKAFSARFFKNWLRTNPEQAEEFRAADTVAEIFEDWPSAQAYLEKGLSENKALVAKAPWSTSGGGVKRILTLDELQGSLGGWIRNTIESQGSIVIEPWLDKVYDLSIQLKIHSSRVQIFEAKRFLVGDQLEYRGAYLGPLRHHFEPRAVQLIQEGLPTWKSLLRDIAQELRQKGYQGPLGVDAMIYRSPKGELRLKPLVELNPRWTMGWIALALEKKLAPGTPGLWLFLPLREILTQSDRDAAQFVERLTALHPVRKTRAGAHERIFDGILPTQDPAHAQEVLTLLVAGQTSLEWNGADIDVNGPSSLVKRIGVS